MNTKASRFSAITIAALAAVAVLTLLLCVGVGTLRFSPLTILRALLKDDGSDARLIIWSMRLPRLLCCATVGVCLALSGCILQGVMRNHMASPSTIGVTSGASFLGYLTLVAFPSYSALLAPATVIGALATTLLIYLLAYRRGVSPMKMILSGLAVSALLGAMSDVIKTFFSASVGNASAFLVGGFNGCGWDSLLSILPYAATGLAVCIFLPTKMNLLMLGDETASNLGLNTEAFRFLLIAVSSLLSGAAIAVAGLISFVGLIVPHIARLLVGSDHRRLLPASALLGAILVMVCDTVGRIIMPPGELPAGIVLSLVGAPFFLWLLRTRDRGGDV